MTSFRRSSREHPIPLYISAGGASFSLGSVLSLVRAIKKRPAAAAAAAAQLGGALEELDQKAAPLFSAVGVGGRGTLDLP